MLSLILTLLLVSDAQAQSSANSTKYFEAEEEPEKSDESKSFTAKVKVVREESDGVDVFFEGEKAKGAYFLSRSVEHYGKMIKDLEKSKKPKGPTVAVTADKDKNIKKVELKKAEATSDFKIPDDPNQKWDFGKPPE